MAKSVIFVIGEIKDVYFDFLFSFKIDVGGSKRKKQSRKSQRFVCHLRSISNQCFNILGRFFGKEQNYMNPSSNCSDSTERPCSLTALLPLGMSCRGRVDAFARSLQSRLRTLGTQVLLSNGSFLLSIFSHLSISITEST